MSLCVNWFRVKLNLSMSEIWFYFELKLSLNEDWLWVQNEFERIFSLSENKSWVKLTLSESWVWVQINFWVLIQFESKSILSGI